MAAISALDLVDGVIAPDSEIVLELIECLRKQIEEGRYTYGLTDEQHGKLTEFDIRRLEALDYELMVYEAPMYCCWTGELIGHEKEQVFISIPRKFIP